MNIEFQNILEVDKNLIELVRNWRNSKKVNQYMYTNHYISKEEHQKWMEKLRAKDTAIAWIIKYNGKPVGIAQLSNIDYEKKITEWGFYIADESVRGKGIGRALIKSCLLNLAKQGIEQCNTFVLKSNELGQTFWKNGGWTKFEEYYYTLYKKT